MLITDNCCTIVPYFRVHDGQMAAFKEICERFMAKTAEEPKCLYYGFSFSDNIVHCREGYVDAEGLLFHLENIGSIFQEALKIADVIQLEIHGSATELAKLREPLASLNAKFFTLEYGFRR